jgi:hypothetical protein
MTLGLTERIVKAQKRAYAKIAILHDARPIVAKLPK